MTILAVTEGDWTVLTTQTQEAKAPASIISGNLLRLHVSVGDDRNVTVDEPGWTLVKQVQMTAGIDGTIAVFRKIAGGSEPATYTVDIDGGTDAQIATQISQFSGVDATTPEDAAATSTTDIDDTEYDPPAITTITDGAFVESHMFARQASITTPSAPSGYTKYGTVKGSTYYGGSAHKEVATAGSEDPGVWTSLTVSSDCCGITWAMRPAGAAAGGLPGYHGANRGIARGVARGVG
jgi:hypothetical protein